MVEREPVRAGSFYPSQPELLTRALEQSFTDPPGPGTASSGSGRSIKGAVVPHAGYTYSGSTAARVYSRMLSDGFPETVVIAGPNHSDSGDPVSVYPAGRWNTPLGSLAVDSEFAAAVTSAGGGNADRTGHQHEHSVEVQLPFLLHLNRNPRIVPVSMRLQTAASARDLGQAVARAARDLQRDIVFLASSDFTHAGLWYMQTPPPGQRVDRFARQQDKIAIDRIIDLDPAGLLAAVDRQGITMCGHGCIAAMLFYAADAGAERAELLSYATSYDVAPADAAVGYAAILVT